MFAIINLQLLGNNRNSFAYLFPVDSRQETSAGFGKQLVNCLGSWNSFLGFSEAKTHRIFPANK